MTACRASRIGLAGGVALVLAACAGDAAAQQGPIRLSPPRIGAEKAGGDPAPRTGGTRRRTRGRGARARRGEARDHRQRHARPERRRRRPGRRTQRRPARDAVERLDPPGHRPADRDPAGGQRVARRARARRARSGLDRRRAGAACRHAGRKLRRGPRRAAAGDGAQRACSRPRPRRPAARGKRAAVARPARCRPHRIRQCRRVPDRAPPHRPLRDAVLAKGADLLPGAGRRA